MIPLSLPVSRQTFLLQNFIPLNSKLHDCAKVCSTFVCRDGDVHTLGYRRRSACNPEKISADAKTAWVDLKKIDVVTLGNLCVDIVLHVPRLPPESFADRKAYHEQLCSSPPDERFWEAGGSCNAAIAAARLGLKCTTVGHVGDEMYGRFLLDLLKKEGIDVVDMIDRSRIRHRSDTLLCWVLVDPLQRHGFCGRADFSGEPAFFWSRELPDGAKRAIEHSKILFCNGYGFDDLQPELIVSSMEHAVGSMTSIFFDPGPRGKTLLAGTPEQQRALGYALTMSDAVILTAEEAESLTGIDGSIAAGKELLRNGVRTKWVIIKMGSKGSALITRTDMSCASAFKVNVVDTVGCGDSFVAAIAFGFIHGLSAAATLAIANAVGAATAMGSGAGRNVARVEQVIELLRHTNMIDEQDEDGNMLSKTAIEQAAAEVCRRCKVETQTMNQ